MEGPPRPGILPNEPPPVIDQVIVEGYTPVDDLSKLQDMIETLRAHPAVETADLLPDDKVRADPVRDERWDGMLSNLFAIQITPARAGPVAAAPRTPVSAPADETLE